MGGFVHSPLFFGIKYLSPFKRSDGSQISQANPVLSQARVTRLNDQLGFTRTCIKTPCNYVFINLILNPVSFDDEKR